MIEPDPHRPFVAQPFHVQLRLRATELRAVQGANLDSDLMEDVADFIEEHKTQQLFQETQMNLALMMQLISAAMQALPTVIGAVTTVEQAFGDKASGAQKKAVVMTGVQGALSNVSEGAAAIQIVAPAISGTIDAVVAALNQHNLWPHGQKELAKVQAAAGVVGAVANSIQGAIPAQNNGGASG